jgi:hypothetical protein
MTRHLVLLGLEGRPLVWAESIESGSRLCDPERDDREWLRARARARRAAGWRPAKDLLAYNRDLHGASLHLVALWEAVASAAFSDVAVGLGPNTVAPWLADALLLSLAPPHRAEDESVVCWTQACIAILDAYEAGLGFFWVLDDRIVAVPRPGLSISDRRLHDESGPAIRWADGSRQWFWEGLRVSQAVVESPESLTAEDVLDERNLERRRVMLERMGYERYVLTAGGRVVAKDAFGRLWECRALPGEREPLFLVEVENSTPEPDGSTKRYFLRVPPSVTPHEAVAWTFGIDPSRYEPVAES